MELRVIVWQLQNVPGEAKGMDFGGMGDFYVRCLMSTTTEKIKFKETDTHFRAKNGKASWNYRMMFPVELSHESKFNRLTVQLWEKDIFSADDIIAESSLVLDSFFLKTFRKKKKEPVYWDRELSKELVVFGKDPEPTGVWGRLSAVKTKVKEAIESIVSGDAGAALGPEDPSIEGVRFWVPLKCKDEKGNYLKEKADKSETPEPPHSAQIPVRAALCASPLALLDCARAAGKNPRLLVSVQLVPEKEAKKVAAGEGQSDPNMHPTLPKPVGRMFFTLNPFTLLAMLCGDKLAADCRNFCIVLCCIILIGVVAFFVTPVLFGNIITDGLTG